MKDLAVLIPVYNDEKGLETTLNSIDERDNRFTVFLIDDGSDQPIKKDFNYPFHVEVVTLEKNKGIVSALNAGIKVITDKKTFNFIARLDCADTNKKDRFHCQYNYLLNNPDVDLLGSNAIFHDSMRKILFTTCVPISHNGALKHKWKKTCFIHPAVMFKTSSIVQFGLYSHQYKHIEDKVLFDAFIDRGKTANIKECLVECEIRDSGISGENRRHQLINVIMYTVRSFNYRDKYWYLALLKNVISLFISRSTFYQLKIALGVSMNDSKQ